MYVHTVHVHKCINTYYITTCIREWIHACMCTYSHTCTHTYVDLCAQYINTYLRTHIRMYLHTCIHECIRTCIRNTYMRADICTIVHTYILLHTCVYACLRTTSYIVHCLLNCKSRLCKGACNRDNRLVSTLNKPFSANAYSST